MTETSKKPFKSAEDIKQEQIQKTNAFNRFLLFRYSLPVFFFANLYWLIIQLTHRSVYILLPIVMVALMVAAFAEQVTLFGKTDISLKLTKRALLAQRVMNLLVMGLLLVGQGHSLFPIFSTGSQTLIALILIQLAGLVIISYNLRRIGQIEHNCDPYYYRFQKIKQSY